MALTFSLQQACSTILPPCGEEINKRLLEGQEPHGNASDLSNSHKNMINDMQINTAEIKVLLAAVYTCLLSLFTSRLHHLLCSLFGCSFVSLLQMRRTSNVSAPTVSHSFIILPGTQKVQKNKKKKTVMLEPESTKQKELPHFQNTEVICWAHAVCVQHKWNLTQANESVSEMFFTSFCFYWYLIFLDTVMQFTPVMLRHVATRCVRLCCNAEIPGCSTVDTGSCR